MLKEAIAEKFHQIFKTEAEEVYFHQDELI